jgi:hypothetical protein
MVPCLSINVHIVAGSDPRCPGRRSCLGGYEYVQVQVAVACQDRGLAVEWALKFAVLNAVWCLAAGQPLDDRGFRLAIGRCRERGAFGASGFGASPSLFCSSGKALQKAAKLCTAKLELPGNGTEQNSSLPCWFSPFTLCHGCSAESRSSDSAGCSLSIGPIGICRAYLCGAPVPSTSQYGCTSRHAAPLREPWAPAITVITVLRTKAT